MFSVKMEALASPSDFVRVGNEEQPLSCVWGTQGARRQHTPFRIEPDLGQVSENSTKSSNKERCHVFHDDVLGS